LPFDNACPHKAAPAGRRYRFTANSVDLFRCTNWVIALAYRRGTRRKMRAVSRTYPARVKQRAFCWEAPCWPCTGGGIDPDAHRVPLFAVAVYVSVCAWCARGADGLRITRRIRNHAEARLGGLCSPKGAALGEPSIWTAAFTPKIGGAQA